MNVYNSGQQGLWNSHSKRIKLEGQNISGDSVLTREKLYSGQQNKNSSDIPEIDYFSFGVCDIIIWSSPLGFTGTESLSVLDDLQQMVEDGNQKVILLRR